MRYEYLEPFVNSTVRVLGGVIQSNVERGAVSLAPCGAPAAGEIAIAVRLFGDSDGNVMLRMNTATAANICARLNGTRTGPATPLGIDSLSELANMIAGNAVSALNNEGFDFNLSPPQVVARQTTPERDTELEAFNIPLTTDCGEVTIHVTLKTH